MARDTLNHHPKSIPKVFLFSSMVPMDQLAFVSVVCFPRFGRIRGSQDNQLLCQCSFSVYISNSLAFFLLNCFALLFVSSINLSIQVNFQVGRAFQPPHYLCIICFRPQSRSKAFPSVPCSASISDLSLHIQIWLWLCRGSEKLVECSVPSPCKGPRQLLSFTLDVLSTQKHDDRKSITGARAKATLPEG